jgi:hypothetical protein
MQNTGYLINFTLGYISGPSSLLIWSISMEGIKMEQLKLKNHQVQKFYTDIFAEQQVEHFMKVLINKKTIKRLVVDVGGGQGYFAKLLNSKTRDPIRVIDCDEDSIERVLMMGNEYIIGVLGDALNPKIHGDESIICFNLILHHIIGDNEKKTRELQKKALSVWTESAEFIFVNEYIYNSFVGNSSGRLIYEITKNKFFSWFGKIVGKVVPSLNANTFGVGVRFRSNIEWVNLFEEIGYSVISNIHGDPEYVSLPRRILLISQIRRDSFLLKKNCPDFCQLH